MTSSRTHTFDCPHWSNPAHGCTCSPETCRHCGKKLDTHMYAPHGRTCDYRTIFTPGPTYDQLAVALTAANALIGEAADEAKRLQDSLSAATSALAAEARAHGEEMARVKELESALAPLANMSLSDDELDDYQSEYWVRAGEIRKARAALPHPEKRGKEDG